MSNDRLFESAGGVDRFSAPDLEAKDGSRSVTTFERYKELMSRFNTVDDVIAYGIEIEEDMAGGFHENRLRDTAACLLFAAKMVRVR